MGKTTLKSSTRTFKAMMPCAATMAAPAFMQAFTLKAEKNETA